MPESCLAWGAGRAGLGAVDRRDRGVGVPAGRGAGGGGPAGSGVAAPVGAAIGGADPPRLNEAVALERNVEPYLLAEVVATSCLRPSLVPLTIQVAVALLLVASVPSDWVRSPAMSSTPAGTASVISALSALKSG